jgi:RNA polymerase sigma factor (sigma-70 family)
MKMSSRSYVPKRPYVAAVLLGTALTALGPSQAVASVQAESTVRAINDLGRYCTACWRNARLPADSWGDCTQEVFHRLLERVPVEGWGLVLRSEGEDRREFVRAIDAVKKRHQRARKLSHNLDGVADNRDQHERNLADQREIVREAGKELLSPRQQRILQMSFEGWTVAEMARELGLPTERVSDEKYKAVQRLRQHLSQAPEVKPAGESLARLTA